MSGNDLASIQKGGIQNLSQLVQTFQRAGPGAFFQTSTNAATTVSPNAYAYTLGTTSISTIGSNQARVGLLFHNPNGTALVAVCPNMNAATATALAAVVNGAGSYTILPYAELRIIGARASCAWNGIANATTSPLTVWEFV
jgi:hypothetical protein